MLIRDIIQTNIVNKLDNRLYIESIDSINSGLQTITFCSVKWFKLYNYIYVDGYKVSATLISNNRLSLILPTVLPPINYNTVITIQKPLLFDGTLSNTRVEWAKYSDSERDKLPFIWLVSPTETNTANDNGQGLSTAILKLWFIHWSDWTKLNADRQNEAVRPLYALYREFMNTINRNTHIFEGYDNVSDRDFPKLGVLGANGVEKTVFDSTLSAVEVDLNLRIFKRYCDFC